jgi:hypothetical protein
MRQLMREQPLTFAAFGTILVFTKDYIRSRREGARVDRASSICRRLAGVNSDAAEVLAKARLE